MPQIDVDELRRWTQAVDAVVARVQDWAKQHGWTMNVQRISLTEDKLGTYEVPLATIETDHGRIVLEPIARWSSPGEGRIDLYSWPSLNRLMLIRKGGDWTLLTEAGVRWPQVWSQATFSELAANLNAAA
jgi:hypothetical protein